jgi:parallel beta-helix repeat protein
MSERNMELSKGMRLGALIANTANSNNNHGIYLNDSSNNNTISDNHLSTPHVPFIAPVLTLIILGMASIFLKRK